MDHCYGVATCTGWELHFLHALLTDATITVYAKTGGAWMQVGSGYSGPTTEPVTVTGSWTQTLPTTKQVMIKFVVIYRGKTYVLHAVKPVCSN